MPTILPEMPPEEGEDLPNYFTAKNHPGNTNHRGLNAATTAITVFYLSASGPMGTKKTPNTKTGKVPTAPSVAIGGIKALNAKNSAANSRSIFLFLRGIYEMAGEPYII